MSEVFRHVYREKAFCQVLDLIKKKTNFVNQCRDSADTWNGYCDDDTYKISCRFSQLFGKTRKYPS